MPAARTSIIELKHKDCANYLQQKSCDFDVPHHAILRRILTRCPCGTCIDCIYLAILRWAC
jgi:hypothetical protein